METEAMITQLRDVLSEYQRLARTEPRPPMHANATRLVAAVVRLAPPGSEYAKRAAQINGSSARSAAKAAELAGVVEALSADLQAGYAQGFAELIHAEVFSDFLDMAHELQTSGYKDAAAVVAGSVLEDHLRKLAAKAGVPVTKSDGSAKKADALNAELRAESVYNVLEQKSVTAWLDLRNKAAHGDYGEYDHSQVGALIRDVREFLIRHPA